MTKQYGKSSAFLLLTLAALALGLGVWGGRYWFGDGHAPVIPENFPGTVLPEGRELPPFELIDDQGRPFGPEQLKGKWTFMFFGYTHCPDVCPTTLSVLKQVRDGLVAAGESVDDVAFVFVSVDPARDSVEHLQEYVEYFDPAFIGVTGTPEALAAFTRPLGAIFVRVRGSSEDNYLVDHTAAVYLLDPEGRFKALLSTPHQADAMVAGFSALRG